MPAKPILEGKRRNGRSIWKVQVESEQHFPRRLAEDRLGKQLPPAQSMPPHARCELDNPRSPLKGCAASKSRSQNGRGINAEQLLEKYKQQPRARSRRARSANYRQATEDRAARETQWEDSKKATTGKTRRCGAVSRQFRSCASPRWFVNTAADIRPCGWSSAGRRLSARCSISGVERARPAPKRAGLQSTPGTRLAPSQGDEHGHKGPRESRG